jgi:hypothetical protein
MELLSVRYARVYLTTQRRSSVAIRIYLGFGFRPLPRNEAQAREWEIILSELGFPQRDFPPGSWKEEAGG